MKDKKDKKLCPWGNAVDLCENYFKKPKKIDHLLEQLVDNDDGNARRYSQSLFSGAIRCGLLIASMVEKLTVNLPKVRLKAVLFIAIFELLEASDESIPKVIHHAVDFTKKHLSVKESRFMNAVLRKVPTLFLEIKAKVDSGNAIDMAIFYSHPQWLVERWIELFGVEETRQFLEWNQKPPRIYLRDRANVGLPEEGFECTDWTSFYRYTGKKWSRVQSLLREGGWYVQDPSTAFGPQLIPLAKGDSVLDLCAAPGGKSLLLADCLAKEGGGLLVSVDLPGRRIPQLKENMVALPDVVRGVILEADVCALEGSLFLEKGLPVKYDAVFLDVPCSNTGVIRRRADVKMRLQSEDFNSLAELQNRLLDSASQSVKPGGYLVYSTCSIEPRENDGVVQSFLAANSAFQIIGSKKVYPWVDQVDGAGAFLLQLVS